MPQRNLRPGPGLPIFPLPTCFKHHLLGLMFSEVSFGAMLQEVRNPVNTNPAQHAGSMDGPEVASSASIRFRPPFSDWLCGELSLSAFFWGNCLQTVFLLFFRNTTTSKKRGTATKDRPMYKLTPLHDTWPCLKNMYQNGTLLNGTND